MSIHHTVIYSDTFPVSKLILLRRSEDFVPEIFVVNKEGAEQSDSSIVQSTFREKYFSTEISITGNLKEKFVPKTSDQNYMPFIIVCAAVLFILLAKVFYWKSFGQWYESLISFTKFRLWLRDTGSMMKRMFLFTTPAYFLMVTLAADFVGQIYFSGGYEFIFSRYFLTLLFFVIIYGIRHMLMKLSSFIFHSQTSTEEQIRNIDIHNTLVLFALCVLLPFGIYSNVPVLHLVIVPLFFIIEGVRIVKGIVSAISQKHYGVYYFFLYFCTVEILPVLIFIKTILILTKNYL